MLASGPSASSRRTQPSYWPCAARCSCPALPTALLRYLHTAVDLLAFDRPELGSLSYLELVTFRRVHVAVVAFDETAAATRSRRSVQNSRAADVRLDRVVACVFFFFFDPLRG